MFTTKKIKRIFDISITKEEELELYAEAKEELESELRDEGLWAKALAKGGSNPQGKYIEYRFETLKADLIKEKEYQEQVAEQKAKQKAEQKKAEEEAIQEAERKAIAILEEKKRRKQDIIILLISIVLILLFLFGNNL